MAGDQRAPGLWEFRATHPEWTEAEGGADGWDQEVAWWALSTSRGLLLIDPLVTDFGALDELVPAAGGCAGIARTIHWHQRSIAAAAARYGAEVWAGAPVPVRSADEDEVPPPDHVVGDGEQLWDGIQAFMFGRDDELALWLPSVAALAFGDVILGGEGGTLRMCPESWTSRSAGGREGVRQRLRPLTQLGAERVLVAHGRSVTSGGGAALQEAIG